MMIVRGMMVAILVYLSWVGRARAQSEPQCSTNSGSYFVLKRLAAEAADEARASGTTALEPAILHDDAACTRLRHAVRAAVKELALSISLARAEWTFFDLGDRYAVLLVRTPDPSAELIAFEYSPFLVFTRDERPRLITTIYR